MESVKANILPALINRQKKILEHYIKIEGLPQYPIDLSSKKGQKLVKDFVSRFTEELVEAYDTLAALNLLVNENAKPDKLQLLLSEYNIEIGDTWHFLCNIIIYCGFEDKIGPMVERWLLDNEAYNNMGDGSPFGTLFKIGGIFNFQARLGKYYSGFDRKEIIKEGEAIQFPLMAGGRKISDSELEHHALLLWEVVLHFHKFTNKLKNRAWHQSESKLDSIAVENSFVEALLSFARYLEFALFTQQSIHYCYCYKNDINLERIKQGR